MKKEMFINAQRDECRIGIVADGALAELYVERASSMSQVGNIYKGRVTNVEPSIQAAFVDFGKAKNGFLHISDLHPQHFPQGQREVEAVGRKRARRDRPPIQACLRRGDEVIVQVTKEGIGTKGATLTTYLSIPGRYLVLMPGMHRLGVSRKIEDESTRSKLRAILEELKPPEHLGFIVRTAGLDRSKADLYRDMHYLLRLWKSVEQRAAELPAPAELYQESDLVIRTIRDVYKPDIERIVCDDEAVACKIKEFLQLTTPRSAHRVELYAGEVGVFHAFGLEQEIDRINSPRVPLPGGGSLVIDQAEALVAIDVNSGRFRQSSDAESTAVRINTEAAREVARQLRLRDLGGVIIIDFIDMGEEKHRRQIEKILRDAIHDDRAKSKILKMSRFGIIEMTRQRVRPSLTSSIFRPCPHCGGAGRIKSEESQALMAMRTLSLAADDERVARVELTLPPPVADYVLNSRRADLARLEQTCATRILVHGDPALPGGEYRIACQDARGSVLHWDVAAALAGRPREVPTRAITEGDIARFHRSWPEPVLPAEEVPLAEERAAPVERVTPEERASVRQDEAPVQAKPAARPAGADQAPLAPQPGQAQAQPSRRSRRRRGGRRHSRDRRPGGPQQPAQVGGVSATPAPPHAQAPPPQPLTAAASAPVAPPTAQPPSQPAPEQPPAQRAVQRESPQQGQPGQQGKRRHRGRRPWRRRRGGKHAGEGGPQPQQQPSPPTGGAAPTA